MSRKNPIHNGILKSDLDANGHKILNLAIEVSDAQIKEAIKPELEDLDSRVKGLEASIGDIKIPSDLTDKVDEAHRLAKDSRTKDDLVVYRRVGGTTEYYLADKFLPVTGPEMYDFSKITFAPGTSAGIEAIQVFDANGVNFGSFRADTLGWLAGDTVSFGDKDISEVTLSSRIVGGSFVPTGANLLTSDKVVLPGADAKSGEVADAADVFKYYRLKTDLTYVLTEKQNVPVWSFDLLIDGVVWDSVDMTLAESKVSSGITREKWSGRTSKYSWETSLALNISALSMSATIEMRVYSSDILTGSNYDLSSIDKTILFENLPLGSGYVTLSGVKTTKNADVIVVDDILAFESSVEAARKLARDYYTENKDNLKTKIPRYHFEDAEIVDGILTIAPYSNAKLASDGTAFTVAVGEGSGYMRDCVLVVEVGETAPTITWGENFHPRTDAETDFACEAGVRNVYWITEHAPDEFTVAGWQETEGGNAA